MQLKLFRFTKIEKTPQNIEDRINAFLEDGYAFKFGCQSESTTKGKFYVSLYCEKKKSNIRAKVFKNSDAQGLEETINKFLTKDIVLKWSTQSSTSSTIYSIIYYELRKTNDKKEANQN